ncbi:arylsulfatase [Algoriphagus halophilus]|uniref:Arylsulfatase A n=1 Tax=Algoriphagus halophilus TaxID=226505 RepID=A0A1N6H638_9BACT|nr:arylsulfatase [Algoriphagus halophilus]SIO15250.1 Arylsulfatase A [Algoriphagus halophilus]
MTKKLSFTTKLAFLLPILSLLFYGCESPKNKDEAVTEKKTNIIFILADDLGYGDLGFLGQQYIETPNIDRLAKEGMFFSDFYSGSTVCAPSRSSFLTGLHTGHTPIRGNSEVQPEGQFPMPDSVMTVGKAMQQAGYVTGAFGKWGLGFIGSTGEPVNQGFEEFFGYNCQRYAHRYYPAYLWHNDQKVDLPGNDWTTTGDYAPDIIQEKTLEFIDQNAEKPFFLFMPIVTPHAELAAPDDELMAKYKKMFPNEQPYVGGKGADYGPDMRIPGYQSQPYPHATFAAMVERIDRYVGEVLDKLEENGLSENTLIIFSSDNGAHQEGGADPEFFDSNGQFRGFKRDLYEGGVRAPMIAWWPNKIKAGTTTDHVAAFWDLLPTFAEVAGQKISSAIDGISFYPTLVGEGEQQEHEYLYWEFHEQGGKQAVRQGNWKAVKLDVFKSEEPVLELYDLSKDPGETNNIANDFPEKAQELESLMSSSHIQNPRFSFYRSEKESSE